MRQLNKSSLRHQNTQHQLSESLTLLSCSATSARLKDEAIPNINHGSSVQMYMPRARRFGYVNAWGIFQAYYEEVILSNENPSDIAWIGSVQYALVFLPGLVTGRLFDIGYFKIPYLFASCLLVACTFLVAECKVYWQFLLAQGIGIGLASGILFGPALGIVSHWFSKRRGLALGVTAIGSSVGGTVFPIAAQKLIPEVGFKWTMRIFGFILILLLGVANLTLDRRLPPQNVKGGLFNWTTLKNPAYAIYCISGVTTFLGLYTMLTYIPVSAVQVGIPNDFSFYFIAIANGTSAFGRILAGLLADRVGAINVMCPFIVVAAIMTFVWPFVTTQGGLIAIAVIYGFSCGTYVSLLPAPVMSMGAVGDVGRRTGLLLSFAAFGALGGPPISGAINSATGGFEGVGWYAGGILLFSVCLLLLTRYLHLGKLVGKF
ncbi:MFS general substrate transporter [Boletus edulis BED1]|uniref:MFS general substrate transporter n=1 Tax=Boletus edulis BED1 TaxID=1328754 RepID=A0AAD4GLJ5_BOLED|nr:MFS general substrate transporter [Boletus edulis BED1]